MKNALAIFVSAAIVASSMATAQPVGPMPCTTSANCITSGTLNPSYGGKPSVRYTNFGGILSYSNTTTALLMAGYGNSSVGGVWAITPNATGNVRFRITGTLAESGLTGSARLFGQYGTGTAPVQGAAQAGTSGNVNYVQFIPGIAGAQAPFALEFEVLGLTKGTPVWFDLAVASLTAGTVNVLPASVIIEEF